MMKKIGNIVQNIFLKVENIYADKVDQNEKLEKIAFFIILVLMGIMLYNLNRPTPWVVDDILKGDGVKKLHGAKQWLEHLWGFYFGWGGRIWGEFFAYIFLSMPKKIFDCVNSFGYLLFVTLLYVNMTGRLKFSPSLLILTNFLLFACLPAFGQDILWISGCANYMWASLIPLLYLMFMRFYYDGPVSKYNGIAFILFYFILGIFSGWSNENVSVGLIFIVAGYMYFYRDMYGEMPSFARAGAAGVVAGSALLWLAPGNFLRFAAEGHSKSFFHILKEMGKNAMVLFSYESTLLLLVTFAALMVLSKSRNKKLSAMFMTGAFLSSIAFGVVGQIHTRVFLGVVMLMCISVGILYDGWETNNQVRKFKFVLAAVLVLGTMSFYNIARDGIDDYGRRWNENLKIIETEKAKGNMDIYVNPIAPKNKFCATYGLDDIKPKENNRHWLNRGVARAFGLNSIQSIKAYKQ